MTMKAWFVLLLAGLVTLGSCTIEKRLYNRGWHVEFNRKGAASKMESAVTRETISPDQKMPLLAVGAEADSSAADSLRINDSEELRQTTSNQGTEKRIIQVRESIRKSTKIPLHLPVVSEKKSVKKQIYKRWDREGKRAAMIAVGILLLLGIIGLIGVLLQLQTAALFGEFIGLLFLVFILGILDFILMLILLAMSFTQSKEQISEREIEKKEKEKREKEMTPEERERHEKSEAKNNREGKIAAGFVVIVLLLILGAAVL